MNKSVIISLVAVAVLAGAGFFIVKHNNTSVSKPLITSFEDCVNAGYPVASFSPRECSTGPDGEIFVENVISPTPIPKPVGEKTFGYVKGHVTIGPNCPGPEREDQPCKVSPDVYTSREAVVYASNGTTVEKRVHLDIEGNYKIALAPGNYFIQIVPAGIGPGEKKPATVKSNQTSVVDFDVDTGIR